MREPLDRRRNRPLGRRAALLGAAGLLAGCETITDVVDSVAGTRTVPLPGERIPVLSAARTLGVDPGAGGRPFALPPPRVNDAWPVAGGTPDHAPGHLALGGGLREAWRASVGSGGGYRQRLTAPPITDGETVFAMDAVGAISAFDAARGGRRWRTDTRPEDAWGGALGGAIALHEGVLYAATGMAEVMALDPADGTIRWRAALPAPARGGIAVAEGRVMVPTVENQLLAHSTEDGRRLWAFRATPVPALMLGQPSPAVADGLAVAGFASGEVVALRVADGRVQWTEALGIVRGGLPSLADIGAVTGLPVMDRGRVHAVSMGGTAISLDQRSGRRVWEREVGGAVAPAVGGDWVFVLSTGNELLCMGREDGRIRWISAQPAYGDPERRRDPIIWSPPLLGGGRLLLAGTTGELLEVDPATGETLSRQRLPGGVSLQPAIARETLFVLTDGGSLVALRGVG